MRVLFVDHSAEIGGGQLVLEQLVTQLPIEPRIAFLSPGPLETRLAGHGLWVRVVGGASRLTSLGKETSLLRRLWAARRLLRIVRDLAREARQADLVYANSKKALMVAALAARKAHRPLIWHQHDEMHVPASLALRGRVSEALLIWLLNRTAGRVISVSQASAETFIAAGGRSDLPVVVHNGIDPAPYAQTVDRVAVRRAAGLPEDAPLIGAFGRLAAWKGQTVLIEALPRLPGVHGVLVGGAIFGESGYSDLLQRLAERLGVADRVHFLGHRDNVPELMQAVDAIVHTSVEFEPFGRVLVEGMLSGRVVVATATGGVPEVVEDGLSGLLVPPGDVVALAAALEYVLKDKAYAAQLALRGRERALERFTQARVLDDVERVIREEAGRRAPQ